MQKALNILLVEDSQADILLLRLALEDCNFPLRLEVVPDGEAAIAYLRRQNPYVSATRPDLILLDLNLPRKNGHEVAAEIKRSSRLCGIPTLILTNSNSDEDKWRSYLKKVDAYLIKPRDLNHYTNLLKYLEENWMKDFFKDGSSGT
jgi:two-component system, chemotaxis family, response regulator Rcp1